MSEVYEWVGSCLQSDSTAGLYLYMSPPKVIYCPDSESTLQELGMVPAVNLFAGWAERAVPPSALGGYLMEPLRPSVAPVAEPAPEKTPIMGESVAVVRSSAPFPHGAPLVPPAPGGSCASSGLRGRSGDEVAEGKGSSGGGTEKKPKWFKL